MGKESYRVAHKEKIGTLVGVEMDLIDSLRRSMSGCDEVEEIKLYLNSLYEKKGEISTAIKTKYNQILALDISKGTKINKATERVNTLYSGVKKIHSSYDTSIEEGDSVDISLLAKSMVKMKEESYEEGVEQFALTCKALSENDMWKGTLEKKSTEISRLEYLALAKIYFELDTEEMGEFIGLCYEAQETDIGIQYTAVFKLRKLLPYVKAGAVASYSSYLKSCELSKEEIQKFVTMLNKYGVMEMFLDKMPVVQGKKNKDYWKNFVKFGDGIGLNDCNKYQISFQLGEGDEVVNYNYDLSTGYGEGGSRKIADALHSALTDYAGDDSCSEYEAGVKNLALFGASFAPGVGWVSGGIDLAQDVENAKKLKYLLDKDLYNQLKEYFDFVAVTSWDSGSGKNVRVHYINWDKNLSEKVKELNAMINDVIANNNSDKHKSKGIDIKKIKKKYSEYFHSEDSTECDISKEDVMNDPCKVLEFCHEFI